MTDTRVIEVLPPAVTGGFAVQVRDLRKKLRPGPGAARRRLRGALRRGVLPARPERGGQDHDPGDPGGVPAADRGHGPRPRPGPGRSADQAARAGRDGPAGVRLPPAGPRGRAHRHLALVLPKPTRAGRPARRGGAGRGQEHPGPQAVRRPAAPPGLCPGPGGRPGPGVPGRADHRLRPGGAAALLGGDREPARPGQDHPAHHPLPGRGGTAGRPDRHPAGRPDRAGRHHPGGCRPGRAGHPDLVHHPRGPAPGPGHAPGGDHPGRQRAAVGLPHRQRRADAAAAAGLGGGEPARRPGGPGRHRAQPGRQLPAAHPAPATARRRRDAGRGGCR